MNEKIRKLKEQIREEERKISNCSHDFETPFYNPKTVKEPTSWRFVYQGSDSYQEPTDYRDVQKPRWTRICKKCGLEQHTYEQKPIVKGYEPSF